MTKEKKFVKEIAKFSVSSIVNFILGFASVIILTRLFEPEQYGFINIFNNTVALILSISYLGLDSSFIRFYNESPDEDVRLFADKLMIFSLVCNSVIICGIMLIGADALSFRVFGVYDKWIWLFALASVASQIVLRYLNIIYRMTFRSRQYTIQTILILVFSKLFIIISAFIAKNYIQILAINVIGTVLLSFLYIFIQRRDIIPKHANFSFRGYSSVFKYAIFAAPLSISVSANNFFGQQIIVGLLGKASVGIFSSASYFSAIMAALQGGFTVYWSAYMFSNHDKENDLIKKVHDCVLFICIIMLSIFIAFRDFLYIFIGDEYHDSKVFFSLVIIYPILSLVAETTCYGIPIKKKNYLTLVAYLISIIINLVLTYILTNRYGLIGAAFANAISGIVLFCLLTYWGQKLYKSILCVRRTIIGAILLVLIGVSNIVYNDVIRYCLLFILVLVATFIYREVVCNTIKKVIKLISTKRR